MGHQRIVLCIAVVSNGPTNATKSTTCEFRIVTIARRHTIHQRLGRFGQVNTSRYIADCGECVVYQNRNQNKCHLFTEQRPSQRVR